MVETPPRVNLGLKERDPALLAAGKKTPKHTEVVLRALSLISISKTNLASLWSTARPLLYAGVVVLLEGECRVAILQRTIVAVREVALTEEVFSRGVEANEEAQGGGGEIGIRFSDHVSLWFTVTDPRSSRQNSRARESSVTISPSWPMLEEIEMLRLSKLRMEVEEPEDL